jgi:hypothetical protein
MWTKVLIFMIIFFLVASPATFKIMRRALGAWVASADGLATPAGLALHGVVLVLLGIYLPRVLMTYAEYEGYASIDDRVAVLEGAVPSNELEASKKRLNSCPKCPTCSTTPVSSPEGLTPMAPGSAPPVTVATTSGPNPQAIIAPGAVAASSSTPATIIAPGAVAASSSTPTTPIPAPMPAGTTSPYFEWNY